MVTASFCPVDKALNEKRKDAGVTLQLLARKENHSELYFTFPEDKLERRERSYPNSFSSYVWWCCVCLMGIRNLNCVGNTQEKYEENKKAVRLKCIIYTCENVIMKPITLQNSQVLISKKLTSRYKTCFMWEKNVDTKHSESNKWQESWGRYSRLIETEESRVKIFISDQSRY